MWVFSLEYISHRPFWGFFTNKSTHVESCWPITMFQGIMSLPHSSRFFIIVAEYVLKI